MSTRDKRYIFCEISPLVSIQSPGSSKQGEVCPRVVWTFQLWKKNRVPDMGGNALEKNWVPTFCGLCFFPELEKTESTKSEDSVFFRAFPPPPHVWDFVFFQSWNFLTTLGQTSSCLLEPGFWILTKGVKRQPVRHQTRPNSSQVLGMEQPSVQCAVCSAVYWVVS